MDESGVVWQLVFWFCFQKKVHLRKVDISFWMRGGHPSFVDEAPEDQSRKESMREFARERFVCWHQCFLNKLAAKRKPEA
jgi:hypothetical protein